MSLFKKWLYIITGTLTLVLGTIGIFLPLLPTTPFWLITAWCYFHSSEKLYNRIMSNPYFGNYIRQFRQTKAIPLKGKIGSVSLLWITILFSAFYVIELCWIRILLLLIAIAVTWHILSYKTAK